MRLAAGLRPDRWEPITLLQSLAVIRGRREGKGRRDMNEEER